jgi:hypothetical protein
LSGIPGRILSLAYHPTVKLVRIVSIVAAAAGLLASHAVASNASPAELPKLATDTSRNWAGYAVTSKTGHRTSFTSVAATWTQPKVQCDRDGSRAAFWVGIGGYGDGPGSLMQIGTNTDCRAGTPSYTTFYEVTPAYAVIVRGLEVRAGDVMRAEVVIDDQGTAHFQIDNRTTFRRFTVPVTVRSPDLSSAEWIAEAPTNCAGRCGSPPLANFGSVSFSRLTTVGDSRRGTILDAGWKATAVSLVPTSRHVYITGSTAGAAPKALSAGGGSFKLVWQPHAARFPEQPTATTPSDPLVAGHFR